MNPLDKVNPSTLLYWTASGGEMESVGDTLFVWCPLARELLYSKHNKIADWLRKVWKDYPILGTVQDCILQVVGNNLNLSMEDEKGEICSYELSQDEKYDLSRHDFIYLRCFDRKEVQICLPDER